MLLFLSLAKGTPFKVGVIEAGAYYPDEPRINIPGKAVLANCFACLWSYPFPGMPAVAGDPQFDWMLMTTPQAGLANAVHLVPRGKVLGGTSVSWDTMHQCLALTCIRKS